MGEQIRKKKQQVMVWYLNIVTFRVRKATSKNRFKVQNIEYVFTKGFHKEKNQNKHE